MEKNEKEGDQMGKRKRLWLFAMEINSVANYHFFPSQDPVFAMEFFFSVAIWDSLETDLPWTLLR